MEIFLLLISLLITLTCIIVHLRSIRNNRKKDEELRRLRLELKALAAQLNPHFTFNTINSIQHYIIKNNQDDALSYLSEFALLIRKVLEFSQREFITLEEELTFLDLYTILEQKRFDQAFDFEVKLKIETPKEEITFPALLLQPLIENAIIHGITQLERKGKITLSVTEYDEHFEVEIKDIRLEISEINKEQPQKQSAGFEIVTQKVELYNRASFKSSDITIVSSSQGTSIKLRLVKR